MYSDIIQKIPLFADLSDREVRALKETSQEGYYQPGEILLREGSVSEYFFIVLEGEVEIIKSFGTPDERLLGVITQGSILGEMSRFSQDGAHTASGRAITPCRLLKVPFGWLDSVLSRQPNLAYELMRLYTSRLENSENQTIKDLREKNRQLTHAYNDLKIAQAAMLEKERLDQEMRLAGKIQRSILPKDLPRFPGLDFGALMIPAKQVGGDFYDFIILGDQRIGILIGDVCDKGMPAALLMALTYSAVRMEALRNDNPGDILRAVNHHLIEIDCSDMFVTLLYGILDCKTQKFNYARAGHPKPLLLDAHKRAKQIPMNYGQAVGIFEVFDVDEGRLSLPERGTLILYSDGLSETIDEHQSFQGLTQLCSSLLNNQDLNAQASCEQLWKTVGGSEAESRIKDDFTVVVVKSLVPGG